jgi:plastocyanin
VTVGNTTTLTATAKDQSGTAMTGLQTTYTSAKTSIATVTNAGVVTGVALGSTDITATGTIGSVTQTAKVTVTVAEAGANASVDATPQNSFDPQTVTIKPNGTVTWTFAALHNVTFDTQGAPGPIGNRASGQAALTFPNAGTFNYHCTIHGTSTTGMRGTVIVQP